METELACEATGKAARYNCALVRGIDPLAFSRAVGCTIDGAHGGLWTKITTRKSGIQGKQTDGVGGSADIGVAGLLVYVAEPRDEQMRRKGG